MSTKVIAGPAGHWYALSGDTLLGLPISREGSGLKYEPGDPPPHPSTLGGIDAEMREGWYEITDPAPGCDDAAIIAALKQ